MAKTTVEFDVTKPSPIAKPKEFETSIELPYRLALSPSERGRWTHLTKHADPKKEPVELWHTRLGVEVPQSRSKTHKKANLIDEVNVKDRTLRAVWSDDFMPVANPSCTPGPDLFPSHYSKTQTPISDASPFRMSMDVRDRCELVHLTSNYNITKQAVFCPTTNPTLPGTDLMLPSPVKADRLMLTALGGYLEAFGQWNPCKVDGTHQLTVQMWEHIATLGRDHYVKVVYKGYLAPFGLRASLVKVTQRVFTLSDDGNWVAILHQHMYIVVKNERKACPILGQPFAGRSFPFDYIEPVTLRTPFLSDPSSQTFPRDTSLYQAQSLFWPMIPDPSRPGHSQIFSFRLRFTDITRVHSAESSMPLLFVASDVAQGESIGTIPSNGMPNYSSQDAVYFYNRGSVQPTLGVLDPYLTAKFGGQKLAFAASSAPGDTDFETDTIGWSTTPVPSSLTLTVKAADGSSYGAANPNAYVEIASATTGRSIIQPLASGGPYQLCIDSGSSVVTVTTSAPTKTPPYDSVSAGPFPISGSASYALNLVLDRPDHFATPPTLQTLAGTGISPIDLYHQDLPYFYPSVDFALINSTSIKRITGISTARKFTFYPPFLTDGFSASTNLGEVFLQKHPDDTLTLQFGGSNKNVDKSGGLASPDTLVVGFSRKAGPVGGKADIPTSTAQRRAGQSPKAAGNAVITSVNTFSTGNFNAAEFFGGLLSAKLLGAVNLSDIIASISPGLASLAKAPQMIEQALYRAEQAIIEVEKYTSKAASAIDTFQNLPQNPLASRLSGHAQRVADANAALTGAGNDVISAAVAEAQLIARIADYGAAVQSALKDPVSLIEDAVISALTPLVLSAINDAATAAAVQISALEQQLATALDTTIQNVVLALTPLGNALAQTVIDDLTVADQTAKDLSQPIQTAISRLAPDLYDIYEASLLIPSLKGDIAKLGNDVNAAFHDPAKFPQVISDGNLVVTDLRHIYQTAGFLAVVVQKTGLATTLTQLRDKLVTFWNTGDSTRDLRDFHDYCLQIASFYDQSRAQQVLQSLSQLETSAQRVTLYKQRFADAAAAGHVTPATIFRQLQLLQNMQGQMLSALSAIQSLAQQIPPGAPTLVVSAASAINSSAPVLAAQLTRADRLWNNALQDYAPIEVQIQDLITDIDATKPLKASAVATLQQILDVRARILANPNDVALQYVLYKLSIDYQRPLAAGLGYLVYIKDSADTAIATYLPPILGAIEKLATTLQAALCRLRDFWTQFRAAIDSVQGPLDTKIGTVIESLFGADFTAIDKAFSALCAANPFTPSEYLRDSNALIAAFEFLERDVHSTITSLPALEAALLKAIEDEAETLLATLLANVPIPRSVNFSYDWHPTIKSCPPVFLLNPDADFLVTARAHAELSDSLSLSAAFDINASLTNFSIALIGDEPFITLVIDSLTFTSHNGGKPDVRLLLNTVVFGASMQFVQDLADLLDPTDGPFIELAADSIRAGFRFAIESLSLGAFNLMQLAIEVAVALPFDGTPVRCEMGLSDQQQPFLLSCGIYGGGGFLQLQLGLDGVQLLQGAFEFGVCADINIGPLVGSGFVVAGIYFRVTKTSSEVCGFVHSHGHMDIFGIVSMDVDLYVAVCYESDSGMVEGIATFSVSIHIAFFTESFSLQAQYVFAGSSKSSAQTSSLLRAEVDAIGGFYFSDAGKVVQMDRFKVDKKLKHQKKPAHPAAKPPQWQQEEPLVGQTTWEAYFKKFAQV